MRALLTVFAALAASGAAWAAEEAVPYFTVPEQFFSADFPGKPVVSKGSYEIGTASGARISVPATVYTLALDGALFQARVADLAGTPADDRHALDYTVNGYRQRHPGLVLDAEISNSLAGSKAQLCGRQFGYAGQDGALHYETLYYNGNARLFYDFVSSVTPAAQSEHGADVAHFLTSVAFSADPKSKAGPAALDYPENWKLYKYPDTGFDIRFPAEPTVEEGEYTTDGGLTVPAARYWVRQGDVLYRLTVARYHGTAADPDGATADSQVAGAVRAWKRQGTVLNDDSVAIGAGQCGRDVTVLRKADGLQARASIWFPSSQHKIYVLEVAQLHKDAPVDPLDDRRFRESLTLALPQ